MKWRNPTRLHILPIVLALLGILASLSFAETRLEVSEDALQSASAWEWGGVDGTASHREVPYGSTPDWVNSLRMQVGGLQAVDMNGDDLVDLVVGCYHSDSYPPYDHWFNMIYFNTGGELEADPSWISTDEVSTGDIQVALINDDEYPDVFAANGGYAMSPSVIYWGAPAGPSTVPGWYSAEPSAAWNNYALPFDFDHDGDVDVITANQGNSTNDPSRPLYAFINESGTLSTVPGWQSAEWCLSNFLAMADLDGDGWEDLAVSKWVNYQSGIYMNLSGSLASVPAWTTGDDDSDKGVAWADVDDNGWPDLALGHDPTQVWSNEAGDLALYWTSGASYFGHSDLRFCDVDRDGDPDLAETHFSDGKVHIYLNRDGVLDTTPSWTYDSPSVGTAIAFGDINGDTWPDLVVGNSGEPCVKVFYATPTTGLDPASPRPLRLASAYPNPFNPATILTVELDVAFAHVELAVHDVDGRRVAVLYKGPLEAGRHAFSWTGRDDSHMASGSGVYLCRLQAEGFSDTEKLVLLK